MLAICPSCDARYTVPDEKIGPDGRTLKCAKCKTVWFARLEMADSDSESMVSAENMRTDQVRAPKSFQSFIDAPTNPKLTGPTQKIHQKNPQYFATAILAACVVLTILIVVSLRSPLLALTPKAAVFYAAIGLPPEQPLKNINFERIKINIEPSTRGTSALKIEGQLVNMSRMQIHLPPIKATFLNSEKRIVGDAIIPFKQNVIGPEQAIRIQEKVENVPPLTQFTTLTFAP